MRNDLANLIDAAMQLDLEDRSVFQQQFIRMECARLAFLATDEQLHMHISDENRGVTNAPRLHMLSGAARRSG